MTLRTLARAPRSSSALYALLRLSSPLYIFAYPFLSALASFSVLRASCVVRHTSWGRTSCFVPVLCALPNTYSSFQPCNLSSPPSLLLLLLLLRIPFSPARSARALSTNAPHLPPHPQTHSHPRLTSTTTTSTTTLISTTQLAYPPPATLLSRAGKIPKPRLGVSASVLARIPGPSSRP